MLSSPNKHCTKLEKEISVWCRIKITLNSILHSLQVNGNGQFRNVGLAAYYNSLLPGFNWYVSYTNNPRETIWRAVSSFLVYKGYITAPSSGPTIARQRYSSLFIIVEREVSAAVSTSPVPVAYTLQLIAANLKPRINPEGESAVWCRGMENKHEFLMTVCLEFDGTKKSSVLSF